MGAKNPLRPGPRQTVPGLGIDRSPSSDFGRDASLAARAAGPSSGSSDASGGHSLSLIGRAAGPQVGRSDPADGRVRAYRRRRRDVVVFNERVRRALGVTAVAAWACWFFLGAPVPGSGGGVALLAPILVGVVNSAAWIALHLLTRRVERGRWLAANAAFWSVFTPLCRDAAQRARLLLRDARVLRREGLSLV